MGDGPMTTRRMNLIGAGIAFFLITIVLTAGVNWIRNDKLHTAEALSAVSDWPETEDAESISLTDLKQKHAATLSYERLQAAAAEWYAAPNGPVTLEQYGIIANEELEQPRSVAQLVSEMLQMYEGAAPFTKKRAASLEYYSLQEPLASALQAIGKVLPFPVLPEEQNEDVRVAAIQDGYKALLDYLAYAAVKSP